MTGARSVAALVAWKTGVVIDNGAHHHHRRAPAAGVSPLCGGMREGRLSLDQVGVIAAGAGAGLR